MFLRKEQRTQAHLFVVMMAYMIERELRKKWKSLEITVQEGIQSLNLITASKWVHNDIPISITVNGPNPLQKELLNAAGVVLPSVLPWKESKVLTKTKITNLHK